MPRRPQLEIHRMLMTKIFGYAGFVVIVCFLAYGFREWYRQKQQNRPK